MSNLCFQTYQYDVFPQTAQNCGSYSFHARIKILTEMYYSHQYLSIDQKKVCHAHSNTHNFDARIKILTEMYWSRQYLSTDPKLPRPLERP